MLLDVDASMIAVREAMDDRVDELTKRIHEERDNAMEAALTYARHLSDGGSPLDYPEVRSESRRWQTVETASLVSPVSALQAVYALWNAERGSTNAVFPIQNRDGWKVAEHLHARLGEAVLLDDLRKIARSSFSLATPNGVATYVERAMNDQVLAEKGKIGAKVAYRLRLREEGEQHPEDATKYERVRENAFALDGTQA